MINNNNIESSKEDCPFPANFEEVFLQEFHRRRDERCFARMKRWCIRQWRMPDLRWIAAGGGAVGAATMVAIIASFGGFFCEEKANYDDIIPEKVETITKNNQELTPKALDTKEIKNGVEKGTDKEIDPDKDKLEESEQIQPILIGH